jgi:hypothetical protein
MRNHALHSDFPGTPVGQQMKKEPGQYEPVSKMFDYSQSRTFGDLLVYHVPPSDLQPSAHNRTAPYWELKPGFKKMVRDLGKIRGRVVRALMVWAKIPEAKKTEQAYGLYLQNLDRELVKQKACYVRIAPLRTAFIPEMDEEGRDLTPFFAFPSGFQRKEDARLFGEFLYELSESRYFTMAGGAPRGTRALTLPEQKLAEKMRRRGKGTTKGSYRIIASRIAELRNIPIEEEGQALPTLIQDLKRHFRRKGLIRRK